MASQSTVLVKNRVYCPHCEQNLSKTTFYAHKRSYFNKLKREWSKSRGYFAPPTSTIDDVGDLDQVPCSNEGSGDEVDEIAFDQAQDRPLQVEDGHGTVH